MLEGHLRAKEVTKTRRSPYPTRRWLVTAWQKDQETLMKWNQTDKIVGNGVNRSRTQLRNGVTSGRVGEDNAREDLEERGIQLPTAYGKAKNREDWRSIIRDSSSAS